jgi:Ca-activated chloride channel family protein
VGKGGKVPFPDGTDLFGNPSYRELEIAINPALLQQISKMTGGEYYRATDRESLRAGLSGVLDHLDKSKLLEGGASANYREEFSPFLLAAFVFAALELVLRATLLRVFP